MNEYSFGVCLSKDETHFPGKRENTSEDDLLQLDVVQMDAQKQINIFNLIYRFVRSLRIIYLKHIVEPWWQL